jgi:two-component system sensor histidine kinase UhpB
MHNIIRQLRPSAMDNMGLAETLKDMISNYQVQHPNLKMTLSISGQFEQLGENININVYRIVQEAINNAVKHASASQIAVKLEANEDGGLSLNIQDDGKGMDMENIDQTNHFGLLGMRERIQGLHGQFEVVSNMQEGKQGTTILITIPRSINQ